MMFAAGETWLYILYDNYRPLFLTFPPTRLISFLYSTKKEKNWRNNGDG